MTKKLSDKYLKNIEKLSCDDIRGLLLKLSGERDYLYFLLENLQEGVFVVSYDGLVIYLNEGAKQLLSKSVGERVSLPLRELVDDAELRVLIERLISENRRELNVEQSILLPAERLLNVSIIPLPVRADTHSETLVILSDITDKRRLQVEKERNEKIESLIHLAAGIAHEIGNPLNSIGIHLNLLEQDIQNLLPEHTQQTVKESLSIVKEETRRLDRIVKNFLAAARSRTPQFKMCHLNMVIQHVCILLKPEFEEKHAMVILNLDDTMPQTLMDEERIRQMLINLFKNAIEAVSENGVIEISTAAKGRLLSLSIKDDGCGIPENALNHIFDAYYTTKKHGSGLGLMIVYAVVREHGGRIEVRSREHEGTEFIILLPLRREKLKLPKGVSIV